MTKNIQFEAESTKKWYKSANTITKDVVDGTGEPEIVRGEAPAQAKTAGSRRTSRTHKKDKPETA